MNEYLTVAGRIRGELQELDRVVERTLKIWKQAKRATDDYYVDATALNLHSFYAGIERTLELIASGVDKNKPSGANWHQELLQQMSVQIPKVRPVVLSVTVRNQLDTYRGFRHVVRNVYTYHLDPEQIDVLVGQLKSTLQTVSQELFAFADFLEEVTSKDSELE